MVPTRFERGARSLFQAALHLYPAAYRDEYGKEMTLVFLDRLREESNGVLRLGAALGGLASVVADAPREHGQVLVQDLRLAFRLMRKEKWFAAVAVGTIAIGIGASTAVFSVGKSLLVDRLPYREAERAAMVWVSNPRQGFDRDFTSFPRLRDWRASSRLIETFAAYTFREPVLTGLGDPEQLRIVRATPEFFDVVRTEPVVGRVFATGEEQTPVAVLSHGFWQRRFGGQPGAVGQTLRLDSVPYTIVGVLPPRFQFPERTVDAWVPMQPSPEELASRGFWLRAVARLAPGVSLAQAQQEMTAIAERLSAQRVEDKDLGVALVGLRDEIAGPYRAPLALLTAAVVGVLLIACVNVASMLTARGAARRQEVAIRTALGASRRRVGRQLLTEALVLFLAGGLLGVALGWGVLRLLMRAAPPALAFLGEVSLDLPMLGIALAMAALTGVLFGVLPSFKAAGGDLVAVGGSSGKGAAVRSVSQRARRVLVVSQIAMAVVVVSTASLMVTSLIRAQRVDLGFGTHGVLTARIQLPRDRYREPVSRHQFFDRLLEEARGLSGVTGAAASSSVLLDRLPSSSSFTIEGRAEVIQQPLTFDRISPDFFRVLQVPLLRGRFFTERDDANSPLVAILNETAARTHWPHEDPLGKRFKFGSPEEEGPWLTVVGVVADTRRAGIDQPGFTESYQPHAQDPGSMTVLVRTPGQPAQLVSPLRAAIGKLDPGLALAQVAPLDALIDDQIAPRRFNTWLLTAFGLAAVVLTAIGLYSLLAYLVALRRHEMAVRLSIGATPGHVLGLIARDVSAVVGLGAVLGLAGGLAAAASIRGLLFGVRPTDPLSHALTLGMLAAVAAAAACIPLRRAMRIDPAIVLRIE